MTFRHWTPSCQLQPATTLKVWNPSPSNWQHRYLKVSSLQKSKLQPRGMCIYYKTPQSLITGRYASWSRWPSRESRSLFTHGLQLFSGQCTRGTRAVVCVYVCVCLYVYMDMYVNMYIYVCIYIYICMYTCICVYLYIYVLYIYLYNLCDRVWCISQAKSCQELNTTLTVITGWYTPNLLLIWVP